MYKNVLNQRMVAPFLWFSSCYSFFLTETQPIKANQSPAIHNILNNPSI
jgi:hypothetical protein